MTASAHAETAEGRAELALWAQAKLARRSLAAFVQLAVAAGVIQGASKLDWGPHLDALCAHIQLQLEGWLAAHGFGSDEMVDRQRAAWVRTRAVWEDREPEPWRRYVLVQNQIFNLAPGTFKSSIVMVCANAWVWLWAPEFIFGASSGIDANVSRDSNMTREIIRSQWYRDTFGVAWETFDVEDPDPDIRADIALRHDVDSVSHWGTTAGGIRYSRTWQRGFTGLHCDGLFGDDPDDADRVWNETARVATQNKWTNAMETRVNDEHRSIRVVMQQVVHWEGMTAYLLAIARWSPENPKGWAQLCLPAEYLEGPADAPVETPYGFRDWRTYRGEVLHPRLSPGVLADKKRKLPSYNAQYNQNADRVTTGIFARRYARFFAWEGENVDVMRLRPLECPSRKDQPPIIVKREEIRQLTASVDAMNSLDPDPQGKTSAVGLIVGGTRDDERYICDDRTRVLGVNETYLAVYELITAWMLERVLVELKALGAGVIAEVERSIKRGWYLDANDKKVELLGPDGKRARCVVEAYQPGKEDKVQRANAMLPDWQAGLIFLHDGAGWLEPHVDANRRVLDEGYIGEICSFPRSRRSDRMDATTQFHAKYRGTQDVRERWKNMSRSRMLGGLR